MIGDCLVECGGSMGFWSIVEVTGLAPVEVLLGLLLGGLSIAFGASGAIGFGAEWDSAENFYRRAVITPC
jgi:hypothetical protein